MSTYVSDTFKAQYGSEVHHVFQSKMSFMKNAVRVKTDVNGSTTNFPVAGTGTAATKSRHGQVPTMNATRSNVTCTLTDHYAADYVDILDLDKLAYDDRMVINEQGAAALQRKIDSLIVAALDTQSATVAAGSTGLTKAKVYAALEALGNNNAFERGQMFAFVGWEQWAELLEITEFASADYIDPSSKPWIDGYEAKFWLGTTWVPFSGLSTSGSNRLCYWFNRKAVGAAYGTQPTADISWVGEKAAWFFNHFMSMGACIIDSTGIARIDCVED